jgi:ribosomal protein S21
MSRRVRYKDVITAKKYHMALNKFQFCNLILVSYKCLITASILLISLILLYISHLAPLSHTPRCLIGIKGIFNNKLRLVIKFRFLISLAMWGLIEQAGVRFVSTSLQSLRGFAPGAVRNAFPEAAWNAVQQRGIISVDVQGNKAEKALRTLKRRVVEEGFKDTWDAQRVFMKPTHERKLAATETAKRLRKRVFREKLRWIMRRNSRGF